MDVQKEFQRLKSACIEANGEAREQTDREMEQFFNSLDESQRNQLIEAVESDFKEIHRRTEEARMLANRIEVRKQLEAVLPFINVSAFARHYFQRSSSWFYQRLNGNTVNGKTCAFTNEEIGILCSSLKEVGSHLMASANTLQPMN
ncbi:MAG: DUF5053 domain-containing protein [Bacteroides sp.]